MARFRWKWQLILSARFGRRDEAFPCRSVAVGLGSETLKDGEEVGAGTADGTTTPGKAALLNEGAGAEDALAEGFLVEAVALLETMGTDEVGVEVVSVVEDLADAADEAVEVRTVEILRGRTSWSWRRRCRESAAHEFSQGFRVAGSEW